MDELAIATLNAAIKEFHGDVQRTYLTGLSMGGYGSWYLAEKYPGRFAALIVICGGIRPPAGALKAEPGSCEMDAGGRSQELRGCGREGGQHSCVDFSWRG